MAARAQYKIILRGKRGGFAKIQTAVSFEIFYGKRKVLTESFGRLRAAKSKKALLQKLVAQVEKRRLLLLAKKRQTALENKKKKARAEARAKKVRLEKKRLRDGQFIFEKMSIPAKTDRELFQKSRKIKPQYLPPEQEFADRMDQYLEDELMDFESAYSPDTRNMKNWMITNSTVTPVTSALPEVYKKQVIFKDIELKSGLELRYEIVNIDFEERSWIMVRPQTFISDFFRFYTGYGPHLRKIWKDYNKIYKSFFFRIKILRIFESGKQLEQGIAVQRRAVETFPDFLAIIFSTYMKIRGLQGTRMARNYLEDTAKFYITGFSMEMSP